MPDLQKGEAMTALPRFPFFPHLMVERASETEKTKHIKATEKAKEAFVAYLEAEFRGRPKWDPYTSEHVKERFLDDILDWVQRFEKNLLEAFR